MKDRPKWPKVRVTGLPMEGYEGPAFGVRVLVDGEEVKGVKDVQIHMGDENYAEVTVMLYADVELDERFSVESQVKVVQVDEARRG